MKFIRKLKRTFKFILYIFLLWIITFSVINGSALKDIAAFGINSINYEQKSNDTISHNGNYKVLYDLAELNGEEQFGILDFMNVPNDSISKLNTNNKRMFYLMNYLDSIGVTYSSMSVPYKNVTNPTSNIFIKQGTKNEFVLITAHYDILFQNFRQYEGALDNSGSVAVLLNVIQKVKSDLKDKNVAFLFTTEEEKGVIGARRFVEYAKKQNYKITKVICLDGVGRGNLAVMHNSKSGYGLVFRDLFFNWKLFTGSRFVNTPEFSEIDKTVIDFKKYNIKPLKSLVSSTDTRVFEAERIPSVHLTSDDIPHFLNVVHKFSDRIDGLHYNSLKQCEDVLCDFIYQL
ncbi:M20/M25/M40 family metallo-hydrolase [Draconibacterium sediminis]|uniref:M20/M25/M40 family metallo-hydrolase n=1 Tax=Draconibacterium sediminis TaxID=1544798 RepID=UPI0026F0F63C|nr:M20/M25/M40 family metallo-hydrolase [Draconibacterium sediminis]